MKPSLFLFMISLILGNLMKPLVSIVTITFNSAKHIATTMESVLRQDYTNFEYWIIDGGSTDQTLNIAQSYQDPRIKIFSEKDCGISDAMNKGILKTAGEFIGIIHSDDYYTPGAISRAINALIQSKKNWCYGKMLYLSSSGEPLYLAGNSFCIEHMKRFMQITHPTVFCSRSLYTQLGYFDPTLKLAMDYDLLLRFSLFEEPFFINETQAVMRLGGESSRSLRAELKSALEVFKIKRRYLKETILSPLGYLCWMWIKILIKYFLYAVPYTEKVLKTIRSKTNPLYSK